MKATGATDQEDQLYWNRFRNGEEVAFSWLYQRYVRVLYSYGMKINRDSNLVEDAIHDMFTDLWRTRSQLAEAESVRFYLFRSLRRKIHRSLRPEVENSQPFNAETEHWQPTLASVEANMISDEEIALQSARLKSWLTYLPARQYEALILRYYQEFSYAEIAAIMNISEQGARNMIQKALHTLRRLALTICLLGLGWLLNFFFR
ncbi:RNA polymerase sigma factor [Larkinella terrae]|uniref:Sigma-70 family RNA polymerase sigma factor n=1 Tax=Larkinella terrae TaxID=2025311 RepID=A0A7K0EM16_9BACT|nr:sigma-70 family RNA polymerase sigma factor [Larkinella terrae]MRS62844.1 sigma-70 family RNA polymerase sigma factor [Larkinella terrae]